MKCFYHNDIDGRCAGSVVAQYENNYNKGDYFEVDYIMELPLNEIEENEKVYFVDYSFKKDTVWQLEKILDKTKNVIWIDHHTSSLNLEKELPWTKDIGGLRRDGISGAGLTYMYLYRRERLGDCPDYIQLVSDYDCWKFELGDQTTYFKIGIETYYYDALDEIWKHLFTDDLCRFVCDVIDKGRIIKEYIDMDNEQYRDNYAYESEINGLKCLVVNKKSNSWIFGDKIDKYPLVMIWVFNGAKYSYSIFSTNKNIDCSKIAEKFGGGGHRGAAGFSSDELLFKKI
jgi:oligoribonuclease NrnB/cAMP/cGMP phosphodiesterase (DHH superfamily)